MIHQGQSKSGNCCYWITLEYNKILSYLHVKISLFTAWVQGWHSGEGTCLMQMCPRFNVPDLASYLDRRCCWFSSCLGMFFSGIFGISPLLKNLAFLNSNTVRNLWATGLSVTKLLKATLVKQSQFCQSTCC